MESENWIKAKRVFKVWFAKHVPEGERDFEEKLRCSLNGAGETGP